MKTITLIILVALLASTSVYAQESGSASPAAQQISANDIDQEMIDQLSLRAEQVPAYSQIMRQQRKALLALQPHQWQQQLVLYEETIEMLKNVLDISQHTKFKTLIGCLIEETRPATHVVQR